MNRQGQFGTDWKLVQNGNEKRQPEAAIETATRSGNQKRQKA